MTREELHAKMKELTVKTEYGEMSLQEATHELAGWLSQNHRPASAPTTKHRFGLRLGHLRQLASIGQAKLEVPLRDLLGKKGPRGLNPPRPTRSEPS